MESFLFQPMWVFLFLMGFAFNPLDDTIQLLLHRYSPVFFAQTQRGGTTENICYGVAILFFPGVVPAALSGCGILAAFGITTWSLILIPCLILSFVFWWGCAVMDEKVRAKTSSFSR